MAEQTSTGTQLDGLLRPKSVVVVGATEGGGPGSVATRNLLTYYGGATYLVNPSGRPIFGAESYPAISALPEVPDVALVAVRPSLAPAVINECREFGVSRLVVIPDLERGTWASADGGLIRMVGPNCLGYMNFVDNAHVCIHDMNDFMDPRVRGNVALVSQSGGLLLALMGGALRRNLGYTYTISSGAEHVLGVEDYVEWLIGSPETQVLGLIIEGPRDGRRLLSAVTRSLQNGKPVVVLRIGRSAKGRESVRAHTGKVAPDDAVTTGVLRQVGAIVVDDLSEMTETLVALSGFAGRWPRSNRIAAAMISGGAAALVADFSERAGLVLADLEADAVAEIQGVLPEGAQVSNPLDIGGGSSVMRPEVVTKSLVSLGRSASVDVVLFVAPTRATGGPPFPRALMKAVMELTGQAEKPTMVLCPNPDALSGVWSDTLRGTAMVALNEMRAGMLAVGHLCGVSRARERELARAGHRPACPEPRPADGSAVVDHYEALVSYGIPLVAQRVLTAATIAENAFATPMVAKVISPDVPHKADVNALKPGITSAGELAGAFAELTELCARNAWQQARVVVQPMVAFDREYILSVFRDPTFGPVTVFGLGGNLVEVLPDAAVVLANPVLAGDVDDAFARSLVGKVADGYRGSAPVPRQELLVIVERMVRFLTDHPQHSVVELNPVVVDPATGGLVALDYLVD